MSRGQRAKKSAGTVAVHFILTVGSICMVLPFAWMVNASLMTPKELSAIPITWLPATPQWQSYIEIFRIIPLQRMYFNSLLAGGLTTATTLFFSSLAAFAFAKYEFPGRDLIFTGVLATMMIPIFVILIPLYLIISELGLIDTLWAVIVPNFLSAYGIFLMRQFIVAGIPNELLDAARIDGCTEFGLFGRIVLPNLGPALATLGMFTFLFQWNDFLWPSLVLGDPKSYTIPVGLNQLRVFAWMDKELLNLLMAGTSLAVIPAITIFAFLQRYFTQGIVLSGIKG